MPESRTGAASAAPATLTIAGEEVRIERVSGRKASRAMAELKAITAAVPNLTRAGGEFRAQYEAANTIELDRAQARMQYPPRPLTRDGAPVLDATGRPVMVPSFVDELTDADWDAAGGKLRLPRSPSISELIIAIFPLVLEVAEEHVYRLLALFTISNSDVKRLRRSGALPEALEERVDELLDDAAVDELLELAVTVGEVIDTQIRGKIDDLGDRLGNAMRVLGMAPARTSSPEAPEDPTPSSPADAPTDASAPTDGSSTPSSSTSRPTSASDSPENSDATRSTSSTSPTTSSASSADASTPPTPSSAPEPMPA